MNLGKISDSILHTSVLKYTKQDFHSNTNGADEESDCAFSACFGQTGRKAKVTTLSLPVAEDLLMQHVIYACINQLAVDDCRPTGILFSITLPKRTRQSKLTAMMQKAQEICREYRFPILGGHTEISDSVSSAVVSATIFSDAPAGERTDIAAKEQIQKSINAGHTVDLVLTKQVGLEAAALIAARYEKELLTRFPRELIVQAKGFENELSLLPEAEVARESGAYILQTVREGGIFAALWSMSQRAGTGFEVDLKKIPVKQSVIEICNFYDLNPYEILSTGSLLVATEDGEGYVEALSQKGISAALIGRLEKGNQKHIINGEETRCLDKPKPDQIRKILNGEEIAKRRDYE